MTETDRLNNIERSLETHGYKLERIEQILENIAVQNTRLGNLERELGNLRQKYDDLVKPDGTISIMKNYQASCPRYQMRFLWWFTTGVALSIAALAFAILRLIGNT